MQVETIITDPENLSYTDAGILITPIINNRKVETFIRVENQINAIAPLVQQLKQMEKKELKSHIFSQYEDRFQIFLIIGLLLFLTEFIIPTRTKEEMIWEGRFTNSR